MESQRGPDREVAPPDLLSAAPDLSARITEASSPVSSELRARWYTQLVENIDLGLYVLKLEPAATGYTLRNVSTNPAAEKLTGMSSEDWLGRTIDECFPALRARGLVDMAIRVVDTGAPLVIDDFHYEQPGLPGVDWQFSMFALPHQHVGVMFSDVSDRKQAERQTRRMLDELARASRISTMREMASGLAHELNQPLSAIVAYADACLELVESGRMTNTQLADVLQSISNQAERAGRIIHRLRQMIKRDQPARSAMSINDAVNESATLIDAAARQTGVTVRRVLEEGLPEVDADAVQLQHVLFNLFHNGIDAMRDVPQQRRQLEVFTRRISEDEIEVAVRDMGQGLPAEAAHRLFEPFFSTSPQGLGLGLSISRTIIEAHGGRIEVAGNSDCGATARFSLPVHNGRVAHVAAADCVHR